MRGDTGPTSLRWTVAFTACVFVYVTVDLAVIFLYILVDGH